jgi:chemotaxis protein CheX
MIDYMDDLIKLASREVFSTMLNKKITIEPTTLSHFNGKPHVAGAVGFTGKLNGVIYFYVSDVLARQMTCTILGLQPYEIQGDEMVNDVVGELTNMLAGGIKSALCDRGLGCAITIPSVVRGSDFRIETVSNSERHEIRFLSDQSPVLVEFIIKQSNNS